MAMPPVAKLPFMGGHSRAQMPAAVMNATLSPQAFQAQIESQGLRMIHQKPVPCPNVRSLSAPSHEAGCELCYNGSIYFARAEFIGAAAGDSVSRQFGQNGTFDVDTVSVITPVLDSAGKTLDLNFFDLIELPDFTIRYYQRVEHSQSGFDRTQFPVKSLEFAIDATGKQYRIGVDVVVEAGRLRWVGERPGYDPMLRQGNIYSVSYFTVPVFTVVGMPHQLRMAQTMGPGGPGSPNVQARFPQLIVLRRDFIPWDSWDKDGVQDRPEPQRGSV